MKRVLTIALAFPAMLVAGCDQLAQAAGDQVSTGVAHDLIEQYKIADRSGEKMDKCMNAGAIAESFLQAHDAEHYNEWKQTQRTDCIAAGMPPEAMAK